MRTLNIMTFKYVCDCKKNNFLEKNFSYWEDRKITSDENDIISHLKNSDNNYCIKRCRPACGDVGIS